MASNIQTAISGWSTTASSNQPDSTDLASTLREDLQAIQAAVRYLRTAGTIASASTTDLATKSEEILSVSGTTTITALGTVSAGMVKTLVFEGTLVLTHNGASLILPTAANITTAAGDVAVMLSLGSGNWRCLAYERASGRSLQQKMVLIDTKTASTSASLDFTTGIDATTYAAYKLIIKDLSHANDGVVLRLRAGNSGGVISTGTYSIIRQGLTTGAASVDGASAVGTAFSLTGTVAGSNIISGEVTILTPSAQCRIVGQVNYFDDTTSVVAGVQVHGYVVVSGGITQLQLTASTGNLASGTAYLYGILP